MWAARMGHPSVVEVLIKAGASLDIQDKVGLYIVSNDVKLACSTALRSRHYTNYSALCFLSPPLASVCRRLILF